MKRKIFSKLLMVALVIAAVGSFVSCKDYDDDINNLQKQIDAKAAIAQIESLQSQLTAAQTAAQKAQTDATKALADAAAAAKTAGDAATAKALEDAIAKVNAAAEKAATENAAAIKAAADAAAAAGTDAAAAKTAADEAKAAAEKAAADAQKAIKDAIDALVIPTMPDLSGYATKGEVLTEAQIKALISQNAQAKGEYLTATTLSAALADLGISAGSGQVDLTPINNAIAAYKTAIDQLYSMVTSVELIGTWTGAVVPNAMRLNNNYDISFIHGKMVTNESFGNNEDQFFQFADADQVKYTEGADIRTDKNLLIRVNPTNATFTKDQIQLVDSKGNDLSDFIEITEVARYTNLITRSVDNTGLWTVKIKVKDGAEKAAFNRYVYNGGELNANNEIAGGRQIVYAVAIKNTTDAEDATAARYVASTYDLRTRWTNYVPANRFDLDFVVSPTNFGNLFGMANRWGNIRDLNDWTMKDGILGENGRDRIFTNPEMAWQVPADPQAIATAENTVAAGSALTADPTILTNAWPFNDRRLNWGFIEVDPGQTITLSNIDGYAARYLYDSRTKTYFHSTNTTVEYYYVTLDLGNSVESRPSEYNAWKNYKIGGLNTMTKGTESLDLVFDDPTLVGDYIGFRVYAVNYDGTLVDPDGRAFYVHVKGETPEVAGVTVAITANTNLATYNTLSAANQLRVNTGTQSVTQAYETMNYVSNGAFDGISTFYAHNSGTNYVVNDTWSADPVNVHYQLLDNSGNVATNWKDIKSVKVSIDNPNVVPDGSTFGPIYLYGESSNTSGNPILNEIYIYITKNMPTQAASTPEWRASLEPDATGLLTVYPWPADNTGAINSIGWDGVAGGVTRANYLAKDLTLYVNNKNDFENWTVNRNAGVGNTPVILNGTANDDFDFDGTPDDNEPAAWTLLSNASKIGQTYDSHIEYSYDNISTYYDDATQTWYTNQNYIVNTWTASLTAGKVRYANAMDLFSYGLNSYPVGTSSSTDLYLKWVDLAGANANALETYGNVVTFFFGKDGATPETFTTNVPSTLNTLLKNVTSDTNKRLATNAGMCAIVDAARPEFAGFTVTDAVSLTAPVFDQNLYPGGIFVSLSGEVTTLIELAYPASASTPVNTATPISFRRIVPGDVPTADKTGALNVTGVDIFGKRHTIATIPFTLLYNK